IFRCSWTFSACWIAWSLRLFHQIRIPKTDSPATPITTSTPKIGAQNSKPPISPSRVSSVTEDEDEASLSEVFALVIVLGGLGSEALLFLWPRFLVENAERGEGRFLEPD